MNTKKLRIKSQPRGIAKHSYIELKHELGFGFDLIIYLRDGESGLFYQYSLYL